MQKCTHSRYNHECCRFHSRINDVDQDESEMLQGWRDFVIACDPDILTGYNIVGFDIPYLMDRAKALKVTCIFDRPD